MEEAGGREGPWAVHLPAPHRMGNEAHAQGCRVPPKSSGIAESRPEKEACGVHGDRQDAFPAGVLPAAPVGAGRTGRERGG